MTRIAPTTAIVNHATLAVEESDSDMSRYKTVHDVNCKGLRDPEPIHVDAGIDQLGDLVGILDGYAIDGFDEIKNALKPCALRALGLV